MKTTRMKTVLTVALSAVVVIGVGGALALSRGTDAKVVLVYSPPKASTDMANSPSGIAGKSWADLGAEEFAALPEGTQIVDCTPTEKRMPAGAVGSGGPNLYNPGLHDLIDGRCAYDPSAVAKLFREDNVDGTSTKTIWQWTPITAVKLSSLPTNTQIVNCWGKIRKMPPGVRLLVGKDFAAQHPGFHFLTDGRCAVSPISSATTVEIMTKPYDLQWFGTGMLGTPRVGSSSCFGGLDPLINHCGIKTNVRTSPLQHQTHGSTVKK